MRRETAAISPITEIIAEVKAGRIVVLVDDEDRENEGDLFFAAEFVTADKINFLATHGRGLVCMPITPDHADRLGLAPMVSNNRTRHGTNFTASIEAAEGISTGISAADRALTIKVATASDARAEHIVQPGHVFPLVAQPGGVLVRAGHTEACCDLARLAGLAPAAVICEIMNEDGTMARLPDLVGFAQRHGLRIGTITDLIAYRRRHDNLVRETLRKTVTSAHGGDWTMRIFTDVTEGTEHVVLTKGDITTRQPVLVRTHALNVLEDVLALGPAPEGELARAMKIIAEEGRGVVCLFRDPQAKLLAEDEDDGPRTVKQTGLGAQILSSMGLKQLILLTDSPLTRYLGLDAYDLHIAGTRPITKG